ncbi:MAG: class I SAM-dependent methyltransferase [Planctomycetota bacterium]
MNVEDPAAEDYQLLDFGCGEKLERFGDAVVRRMTPSVGYRERKNHPRWNSVDCQYKKTNINGGSGSWHYHNFVPPWVVELGGIRFQLKTTPSGQVGVFPEQMQNWKWIEDSQCVKPELKAINLFGYTGGTTMALAKQGVAVTHVDSSKSVVNWARANSELNGLGDAPIRWIVEDAIKFMRREIKRGNCYDILIADPPSFGRGPKGESWKIQKDLEKLIANAFELTQGNPTLVVLTCHTEGISETVLQRQIRKQFLSNASLSSGIRLDAVGLKLTAETGKSLSSGVCVRWHQQGI